MLYLDLVRCHHDPSRIYAVTHFHHDYNSFESWNKFVLQIEIPQKIALPNPLKNKNDQVIKYLLKLSQRLFRSMSHFLCFLNNALSMNEMAIQYDQTIFLHLYLLVQVVSCISWASPHYLPLLPSIPSHLMPCLYAFN